MKMPSRHTVNFLFYILKGIITGNEFNGFDVKKNKKRGGYVLKLQEPVTVINPHVRI